MRHGCRARPGRLFARAWPPAPAGTPERQPVEGGVWGATEQKAHLSPALARKPLWSLVSSGKQSFC
ncbi:hypothetical protein AO935_32020 [Pseudomonas aeruginosa]|nr:hypothetical protein AO935_32020 [Pseudomonas aeruginosa]HBP6434422.1 hypothetical protein [Pseudomonas aeruginosa]